MYSSLQILIPLYNDWDSLNRLLVLIDASMLKAGLACDVLIVDDGSTLTAAKLNVSGWHHLMSIKILRLRRNLGHQRAICVGLCHLSAQPGCAEVVVLDADGEDRPDDISRLLCELHRDPKAGIVFAERTRRSEGWIFAFFYWIYRTLHRVLVGHRIRVGNFSALNRNTLESLCTCSELWNHFAATAFATRQPMAFISTFRGNRLAGRSTMNFSSLVMHGLSALSVFSDRISTRMLILSATAASVTALAVVAVGFIRFLTNYAIPGWATYTIISLLILLVQIVTFMFTFSFMTLLTRGFAQFIPLRDYQFFVRSVQEIRND